MPEQKICCFLGPERFDHKQKVSQTLKAEIERLIEKGVTSFNIGAGRKLDTMAALYILLLKNSYPEVRLHYIVPGIKMVRPRENEFINTRLLFKADTIHIVNEDEQIHRIFQNAGYCVVLPGYEITDKKQGITMIPLAV